MTPAPHPSHELSPYAGPSVRALFARHGPPYRWMMIGVLLLGAIGTMLAATIVNVALPSIIGVYGLGQDQAQWLATAFLISSTACMLLNTWAVASFGVRTTFIAAMITFIAGSVIGATSAGLETLVAGRILQGAGAGLIQPLAMVLIFQVFPDRTRGTAIGVYALGVILSPAFGPVLGGLLIDAFNWRIVFIATAPLAALGAILAAILLPTRETTGPRPKLDWQGLALVVSAIGLLLSGIADGHREGWTSTGAVIRLWTGGGAAILFLLWEGRHPFPVLNLRLFARPAFSLVALIILSTGVAIYGSTYLLPQFVQIVQLYSPASAGHVLLPAGIAMMIGFPLAGRLSDRIDARFLLVFGVAMFGLSMWLLSSVAADTPFWTLAGWIVLSRIGIAAAMPSANAAAMRQVDPLMLPHAASAATFLTQAGGAFGVNGLAILLQERAAFHAAALAPGLTERNPQILGALNTLRDEAMRAGLSAGEAAGQAQTALASVLRHNAEILAFRDCFFLVACAFALLPIAALLLPQKHPAPARLPPLAPSAPETALHLPQARRL